MTRLLGNHAPCGMDHVAPGPPTITVTMNGGGSGGGGGVEHSSPRSDDHYVDARTGDSRHDGPRNSSSMNCDHQHLHAEHFIGDNISLYGECLRLNAKYVTWFGLWSSLNIFWR